MSRIVSCLAFCSLINSAMGSNLAVETYTASGTLQVTLPGTPSGGGIDFSISYGLTSVDFAPGSVSFLGTSVDFDGTEADFLASSFTGSAHVPTTAGPATVDVTATGTVSGAFNSSLNAVVLGADFDAGFSSNSFDLSNGQALTKSYSTGVWSSAVVPELNGVVVTITASSSITSVDAALGLVSGTGGGTISVPAKIPTLSEWGLILLLAAFLGVGIVIFSRRREVAELAG
ncbi:MAG: IPTL-CTERM sorting domain-containing protein [Planctomycetes bacterium]|nr:IPTL-CTERM sorting domain-containing protein [Planctomycetota bacterium]